MAMGSDASYSEIVADIGAEMEEVRRQFRALVRQASAERLRAPSDGTRWTNRQLLFHMLLGYLIIPSLLIIARWFSLLPDTASRVFARLLDALRAPFHLINYLGPVAGALIVRPDRMPGRFDAVVAALEDRLARESERSLGRGMHYPVSWDPYFTSYMTVADIYRYPAKHFAHHRRQLTVDG